MTFDFYLMGQKGLQALERFCQADRTKYVGAVTAAKDKNVVNDYFEDIKSLCDRHHLSFYERSDETDISSAEYKFAIGWRWMMTATNNVIIFHDSILPRYRGFAPLVNALIEGDTTIGATALWATENYDAGPVLATERVEISHPLRIQKAIEMIGDLYGNMILGISEKLIAGIMPASTPQDERQATYSVWRDEEDYFIDWNQDSERILRMIYACSYPYTGAKTILNSAVIEIRDAALRKDVGIVNRTPGKVIFAENGCPVVICGSGLLTITEAFDQKGKTVLPLAAFRTRFGKRPI